jgi:hypothetical protein
MGENGSSVPYEIRNRRIDRECDHFADASIEAKTREGEQQGEERIPKSKQFFCPSQPRSSWGKEELSRLWEPPGHPKDPRWAAGIQPLPALPNGDNHRRVLLRCIVDRTEPRGHSRILTIMLFHKTIRLFPALKRGNGRDNGA